MNQREHNKQCRYNAQKNHLLQFIQIKANILKQKTMSINLDEARTEIHQSFVQIKAAFRNLETDGAIKILKKHHFPKTLIYTVELI